MHDPDAVKLEKTTFKMSDYRFHDGDEGEIAILTPGQKQAWDVTVEPAGWGGFAITFTPPEGDERSVYVELDKGNPKLVCASCDGGDAEVMVTIENKGVFADPAVGNSRGSVRFTQEGISWADGIPVPSFPQDSEEAA